MQRLILMTIALAGCSQAAAQAVTQQVMFLDADDGQRIPAVLMYPAAGADFNSPAIVFHHGGPGGHPIRSIGAPRWAAERLAERGFTTLSLLSRHSSGRNTRGYGATPFSHATLDIKAAVNWLAQQSYSPAIVLAGHSLGSIRITRYLVETGDPRVKAMVHYAPTRNMPDWMRANLGERRYLEVVDRASRLVSQGLGDTYSFEPFELSAPAPPGMNSGYIQTAATWLDWWGPAALTRNSVWFGELEVPLLLLSGDQDTFVTRPWLKELQAAAVKSPAVDVRWYEGGIDHVFTGVRQRAADDTFDWLVAQGLGPRPKIKSRLVDARAADGRAQSGVLYAPADPSIETGPAFMVMYGYGGDVLWSSNHWLCVHLAQQGHACLAGQTRGAGQRIVTTTLEEELPDISAWVNWLAASGRQRIVLAGHSWGGIRITRYLVTSRDPRVVGMVYLAPTRDGPAWAEAGMGAERYRRVVTMAEQAVAAGDGRRQLIVAPYTMPPPAPSGSALTRVQLAESFLSHWGPRANTVHTAEIAKVRVPILAIAGNQDPFDSYEFMEAFTEAAGGPADLAWYDDGAPHSLLGWEQRVTEDVVNWLARQRLDDSGSSSH